MAGRTCKAGRGPRQGRTAAGTILALTMIVAVEASAAMLREADLPGGAFSADYRAPTRIPAGVDRISGTGGVGSDDYLLFDLPPGAQSIVLEFRAPEAIGYSYSAGGAVLFDTVPFAYEWAGTHLPVPIQLDHRRRRQSMTLTLPQSFGGRLFLALNFTHGEDIAYSLSALAETPVLTTVEAPYRGASPQSPAVGTGQAPAAF
jgi:hypothetical protein